MLKTDLTEGILTVTIDRPDQRNALTVAMSNALTDLWAEIEADDRIRVTVLTSADCGTFCAGMDLKEAAEIRESKGIDVLSLIRDPHHSNMLKVRKPLAMSEEPGLSLTDPPPTLPA